MTNPSTYTAAHGITADSDATVDTGAARRVQPDATTAILTERGKRYGKFEDHARITQRLKEVIASELRERQAKRPVLFQDDQQEAIDMICHKLGRIVNGDPDYVDSWADIAGYARLVADRLEGVSR